MVHCEICIGKFGSWILDGESKVTISIESNVFLALIPPTMITEPFLTEIRIEKCYAG